MDTQQDITKEQFKMMFDYAKANPNEPSSVMFAKKIQAGDFNQFGTYKPKPVVPPAPQTSYEHLQGEVKDVGNFVKKLGSHYAQNVKSGYMNAIPNFVNEASRNDASTSANPIVRTAENALGATISGIDTIFTPITAGIKAIGDTVVDPDNEAVQKFASHPAVSKVLDYITGKSDEIEQTHPEAARNIVNAITLATTLVGAQKAGVNKKISTVADMKTGMGDAITKVNDSIPGMIDNAGTKIQQGTKMLKGTKETVVDKVSKVSEKGRKMIGNKTEQEILNTPENKLKTLKPVEQEFYFKNKVKEVRAKADADIQDMSEQYKLIDSELTNQEKRLQLADEATTEKLKQEYTKSAIDAAQNLKPKAIESFKKNSDIYRKLIDTEIEPVKGEYLQNSEVMEYVKNRYASDPYKADAIIQRLGLQEGKTNKVGEIYDQMKGLRQEISKPGMKGKSVFTSSDMDTNDAIHTLSNFLKENKGIDFSEANRFWSEYAPLRNKIVTQLQPFTPAGAESSTFNTFVKTIQDSIEMKDPNNANFIKAIEDNFGQKIADQKTIDALSKLTDAQKKSVARSLETQAKIETMKYQKIQDMEAANRSLETNLSDIELQKLKVGQEAAKRRAIINALKVVGVSYGVIKGYEMLP